MQFCLILNNHHNADLIEQLNPVLTIAANETTCLDSLKYWSLSIEEKMFDEYTDIDWVVYCNNSSYKLEKFFSSVEQRYVSNCIFTTDNKINLLDQNFYCRPHVFSYLAAHHKISTPNIVNNVTDETKLFFMAMRNNLEIVNL